MTRPEAEDQVIVSLDDRGNHQPNDSELKISGDEKDSNHGTDAHTESNGDTSSNEFKYSKEFLLSFKSKYTDKPEDMPVVSITISGKKEKRERRERRSRKDKEKDKDKAKNDTQKEKPQVNGCSPKSSKKKPPPNNELRRRSLTGGDQPKGRDSPIMAPMPKDSPAKSSPRKPDDRRRGSFQTENGRVGSPAPFMLPPPADVAPIIPTENRWTPKRDANEEQKVFKKVKGILNKLTPEKFETLVEQLVDSGITSNTLMRGVVDIVYDKAVSEPNFSTMYADLCKKLSQRLPSFKVDGDEKPQTFKRGLLDKCQEEFEKEVPRESWEGLANAERDDIERKTKLRSLGNVKFIGELYKDGMLSTEIMHYCISRTLGLYNSKGEKVQEPEHNADEGDLEALAQLLTTIGKSLEVPKHKANLDGYFTRISKLSKIPEYPSRIRFMLEDLVELREYGWVPRRENTVDPKTIDEIRAEVEEERAGLRPRSGSLRSGLFGNVSPLQRTGSADEFPGRRGKRGSDSGILPRCRSDLIPGDLASRRALLKGLLIDPKSPTGMKAPLSAGNVPAHLAQFRHIGSGGSGRDTPSPRTSPGRSRSGASSPVQVHLRPGNSTSLAHFFRALDSGGGMSSPESAPHSPSSGSPLRTGLLRPGPLLSNHPIYNVGRRSSLPGQFSPGSGSDNECMVSTAVQPHGPDAPGPGAGGLAPYRPPAKRSDSSAPTSPADSPYVSPMRPAPAARAPHIDHERSHTGSPVDVRPVSPPPSSFVTPTSTPASKSRALTEQVFDARWKQTVDEYWSIGDVAEAAECVGDLRRDADGDADRFMSRGVSQALMAALDGKDRHRQLVVPLLAGLMSRQLLPCDALFEGFDEVIGMLADLEIDIPRAPSYLSAIIGSLVAGGSASPALVDRALKALPMDNRPNFFAQVFCSIRIEVKDESKTQSLFVESEVSPQGLFDRPESQTPSSFSDFLTDKDLDLLVSSTAL